ncbi:MAG: 30S ribosome-binding factor RbfA [Chloroflexota bacterium]|jgi:ribosome-binding factor A
MSHRIEKINQVIRKEISDLLQREVKDPRLGEFIAVTDVVTSPDLKYARVYVSRIGTEEEKQEILKTLNAATSYFHKELTRSIRIKRVPELSFHWDDSIERGDRLMRLIDQVTEEQKS